MLVSLAVDIPPVVRFPIGLAGGVIATLWMDQVMARIEEGNTPPRVASSVLTDRPVDDAPDRLATVVHYLAGAGTGLLFVWLSLAVEGVTTSASIATVVGTAVLLYALMVGFFVVVPLPRAKGLGRARRRLVLRSWAIAAMVYLIVLVPVVTTVSVLL